MTLPVLFAIAIGATLIAPSISQAEEHQHSPGVSVRVLYLQPVPEMPGKVMRITELTIAPGRTVDPHCHYGSEYGIVTQGTLLVKSGSGDYQSKSQGEAFSVPPRTPMTVKNDTDRPAQLYSSLLVDEHPPYVAYLDEANNCLKN